MVNPYEEIIKLLKQNNITFEVIDHEPVYTCEEAAGVRGVTANQGSKSILIRHKKGISLLVVQGDAQLDSKKMKKELATRDIHFAEPVEVREIMGCEIGACYPFGNIANLPVFMDKRVADNEFVFFNPGRHDKSIKIKSQDMIDLIQPTIVDIIKEV